jgi:crotonobetainyl-CoA:carnitine CoA-transferase CaiB-like acyl-CoA transferase
MASSADLPTPPTSALAALWQLAGMPTEALGHLTLEGSEPAVPSSFAVGTAAQVSMAAAALAANEVWHARTGRRQNVRLDMLAAALECCAYFSVDGKIPEVWDKLSGLYPCGAMGTDGYVRVHANFAHHRDRALTVLGCPTGPDTERALVAAALTGWRAEDFEQACADAGAVVAALRTFDEWDRHPQGVAIAALPVISFERIGEAPPRELPPLGVHPRPLSGVRMLDLTRVLAGPVAGRTLAAHGADVMLVNSPNLPNIAAIADTSRGKLSAHLDLRTSAGREQLAALISDAHVFMQGYRPGALAALGFTPQSLSRLRPGFICVSLSAYGHEGPWAGRRGFDSLVQAATGLNRAEAEAFSSAAPKPLPMQILDYASGYLMALGAAAALVRQLREGGSWHVRVALATTGRWLRNLGRVADGSSVPAPQPASHAEPYVSGYGRLLALPHPVRMSETPPGWIRPSMPPGTHEPRWPTNE